MADRLTQLQDAVNVQADNMCNTIGVLQQQAQPEPIADITIDRAASTAYQQTLAQLNIVNVGQQQSTSTTDGVVTNGDGHAPMVNGNEPPKVNGQMNGDVNGVTDQPDNATVFAKLITRTARDIETLIDKLPNKDQDDQEQAIRRLEAENREKARQLEATIERAEAMLKLIKLALEDIAQNQMMMEQLEARTLCSLEDAATTVATSNAANASSSTSISANINTKSV